ncbi:MAG: hypothetical protein M3Q56_07410 [Bacteroidota bacterium]|nr:hypothetical protein [Bacteroidota bacterium]
MKFLNFIFLAIFCIVTACNEQQAKSKTNAETTVANSTGNTINNDEAISGQEGKYEIHGILDPGLDNMVAFAMKTPRGWKMQQTFTREWRGAAPINIIYIALTSPDGNSMIEYLPSASYYYTDGPTANSLRQAAIDYGAPAQNNPGELAPMQSLDYIKNVLMPQLAQRGLQMQVTGEKESPFSQEPENITKSSAYLDGVMNNGKKVRVDCVITCQTTNMNGDKVYSWNVLPTVTQSSADIEACFAFTKDGQNSVVINPAWQQQNSQLVSNGNRTNNRIAKQMGDAQRAYQDNLVKNRDELAEMRGESQRRISEARRDALGGEAKYDDPATGERKNLDASYNHVYKDKQGTYFFTNSPINPNELDWVELKRVELKDY